MTMGWLLHSLGGYNSVPTWQNCKFCNTFQSHKTTNCAVINHSGSRIASDWTGMTEAGSFNLGGEGKLFWVVDRNVLYFPNSPPYIYITSVIKINRIALVGPQKNFGTYFLSTHMLLAKLHWRVAELAKKRQETLLLDFTIKKLKNLQMPVSFNFNLTYFDNNYC